MIAEFHGLFDGFRRVGGLARESPENGFFTKILRLSIADAPKTRFLGVGVGDRHRYIFGSMIN